MSNKLAPSAKPKQSLKYLVILDFKAANSSTVIHEFAFSQNVICNSNAGASATTKAYNFLARSKCWQFALIITLRDVSAKCLAPAFAKGPSV